MKKLLKSIPLYFCLGTMHSSLAHAGAADYIYTPTVENGEFEIDFKYGFSGKSKAVQDYSQNVTSLGFGYGASERWFTELYLKSEKENGKPGLNILEFENKFQLTETGRYPVDVGLITELELPSNGKEPSEFKVGPLFQTNSGKMQYNFNVLFEAKIGGSTPSSNIVAGQYQLQAKYRLQKSFEFGVQSFGEVGAWDNWSPASEQEHKIGPAIFGKIGHLKYNAAYLFGLTRSTSNGTARLQVEYEF
ncbi:DUF3187 family protein [Hydrogenovibrio marinus]|uniref:Outer membrane protein beta-barrel domain-containing protein n=1 Tax=Hydrogenovibrio marinus TaxID=28885 RepID=A0A066ZZR1_HYDMR|nr:DUF3187 family protein [Hydrogenovibrio marinus]KDN95595.1 hypothetical protein EI16_04650 [Hydrogenovibrio marinus]BBN60090.1 hypothetical protein HVMH_1684 [Hydrogenovibrio marinus]